MSGSSLLKCFQKSCLYNFYKKLTFKDIKYLEAKYYRKVSNHLFCNSFCRKTKTKTKYFKYCGDALRDKANDHFIYCFNVKVENLGQPFQPESGPLVN